MRASVNDTAAHQIGFRYAAVSKNGKCVGYYPSIKDAKRFSPRLSKIVPIVNTQDSAHRALTSRLNRGTIPSAKKSGGIAMLRNPISSFDGARANADLSSDELEKARIILAPQGYTDPRSTIDLVRESYSPGIREFNAKGSPFKQDTVWNVPDVKIPVPEGKSYLPHQVAGIIAMARRKNTLLADQQGLGKTIEIVGYANLLSPDRTLIVCPRAMKFTWIRELYKWSSRKLKIVEVQGTPTRKDFKIATLKKKGQRTEVVYEQAHSIPKDANVIIATYKTFVSRQSEVVYTKDGEPIVMKNSVKSATKNLISEIFKQGIDLLVLDEAHILSNRDSVMSKAFFGEKQDPDIPGSGYIGMANLATNRIFATGTPMRGGDPSTLFHFLNNLSKKEFPTGFTFNESFGGKPISGGSAGRKKKDEGSSPRNMDMLGIKIRESVMVRRLARDVLDLPREIRTKIEALDSPEITAAFQLQKTALESAGIKIEDIKINDVSEDEASAALSDMAEALMDDSLSPEEKAKLEEEIENQFVSQQSKLASTYGSARTYMLAEITKARVAMSTARARQFLYTIGEIEKITKGKSNGKIVVFFHHKSVLQEAQKALVSAGYGPEDWVVVDGQTKAEKLDEAVESFQNDPRVKFFFGSIITCAAGITLTSANICLFLETDWTPANNLQAEKRIHRIGQESPICFFFYSVKERSIDANVVRVILDKTLTQREILDSFPTDLQVAKFDNRFKEREIVGAKYQIPDRYAIRAALLDICKQLGTEPDNVKRFNYDTNAQETIKDYTWRYDSKRCESAGISHGDFNKLARAANELQDGALIRSGSLDENLINEALPILWKVRTFVEKRSILSNINWPSEITGRSAGLFSPSRTLDTSEHFFGLLSSALYEQRDDLHKKFLAERKAKRNEAKQEEINNIIDNMDLGQYEE